MASIKTISSFKSQLTGGGARPNLFEVVIPAFPSALATKWNESKSKFTFMCKSAALPASNVGSIDIPFRGRILKVAGDRTFEPWTITVINDEDFKLRAAFESWTELISRRSSTVSSTDPSDYMVNAVVNQLKKGGKRDGNVISNSSLIAKSYEFVDIFPTNVSAIDLSYDSTDTIEEFTVEFQVQYWKVASTAVSNSNGDSGNTTDQETDPTATTTTTPA